MKLKKLNWLVMIMVFMLMVSACGSNNNNNSSAPEATKEPATSKGTDKTIEWKFGHLAAEDHAWHKTAEKFADLVNEKTNGQINITLYPNNQLGGETDTINSIKAGTVDMMISGETMANWAPKAALLAVPYAFRDDEHLNKAVKGDIGQEIKADIIENVGLTPLYYHTRAPRNLTSNKAISTPADLNGFKMRVPNVPLFLDIWEAAGARPQVMDFNEVFTGLQQNVIEGQENPVDLIQSAGFYEVQKYVNVTEHVRSWIYILVGNDQFAALNDEQRAAVLAAAEEAQAFGESLFIEEIDVITADLKEKGMTFNEVDQAAFREAMLPAVEKNLTEEQYELYEKILDVK
jgi:tripartite ATP-independent transporter DctP family solute receptor